MISLNFKIYKEHKKKIKNLNIKNSGRVIICFSGIPGAGKTTIAKKIEKKYQAVKTNNDDVREVMKKLEIKDNCYQKLIDYQAWLIPKIAKGKNKIIIIDASIDRKYKEVFKLSQSLNYKLFIIKIDIPKNLVKERIKKRNKNYKDYFECLDRWIEENKKCGDEIKSFDFIVKKDFNIRDLYKKLDKTL